MNEVIGTFGLLTHSKEEALRALPYVDRVRAIVDRQVELRGGLTAFTFRAHGFRWRWQPTQPYSVAPETFRV